MYINKLPPLPPSLNSCNSVSSTNTLDSTGNIISIQIKELQALIAKFQTALQAPSPNYVTIADYLNQIETDTNTLKSLLNHAGMSSLEGYLTLLYTDIGNKNYSAAVTDLTSINNYLTSSSPFVDFVSFLNAWDQLQTDLNAAPPVQKTIQADWDSISALMAKLYGETTGMFQEDIHNLQGYLTDHNFQTDITNSDWSDLLTTTNFIINGLPTLEQVFN